MTITITLDNELEKGHGILHLPEMTQENFYEFCQRNPRLNTELTVEQSIVLMAPVDSYSSSRIMELISDLII